MAVHRPMADRNEEVVREPPVTPPVRAVGGELVPDEDFVHETLPALVDTLMNPDAVGSEASRVATRTRKPSRLLGLALDAADTIQAGDSLGADARPPDGDGPRPWR